MSPSKNTASEPQPENQFVDLVSRMLELPPADRVLGLRAADGRALQLVLDSMRPLTLRLAGPWSDRDKQLARILMQAEAESRPDLARLLVEDDVVGVVFTSENPYSASDLIYRLAAKVLRTDPAELSLDKDYEEHDARPGIAAALDRQGTAEILHQESGVRVRLRKASSTGYTLEVPTASLDPRRGQRHRARQAITDAGWRQYDGDTGSGPDVDGSADDPGATWGYSVDRGDSSEAADAALRLLCTIAQLPIDVRVSVK